MGEKSAMAEGLERVERADYEVGQAEYELDRAKGALRALLRKGKGNPVQKKAAKEWVSDA